MIESIIRWSIGNRFFVLLATLMLVGIGLYSLKNTPVDAIPDLSDVQVIIKTSFPGQAPQVVEDQGGPYRPKLSSSTSSTRTWMVDSNVRLRIV